MKPLKLSISGLQSFREKQVIDFDALSIGGMFGIFGPTGSGKSTILDAITLALYGEVGRGQGTGKKTGIINENEDSASVAFEFSIGAGAEGRTYCVERRYKKDSEKKTKAATIRLIERTSGDVVLADGESNVTKRITAIIGITADDFIRAVVLPQGKFAEFLTLDARERRDMLERLFKLEKYGGQLAMKLKKCKDEMDARLGELEGELKGMGDASGEAVAAAAERAQLAEAALVQAGSAYNEVKTAYETAKTTREIQIKLLAGQQKLDRHTERTARSTETTASSSGRRKPRKCSHGWKKTQRPVRTS